MQFFQGGLTLAERNLMENMVPQQLFKEMHSRRPSLSCNLFRVHSFYSVSQTLLLLHSPLFGEMLKKCPARGMLYGLHCQHHHLEHYHTVPGMLFFHPPGFGGLKESLIYVEALTKSDVISNFCQQTRDQQPMPGKHLHNWMQLESTHTNS